MAVDAEMDGKVALVTGAGSGIGRASARAFARRGARVVVSDVDVGGGRDTVQAIEEAGGTATFVEADVSDEGSVAALVEATVAAYGGLDFAHNNAGIAGPVAATPDYPSGEWHRIIGINLSGVFFGLKYQIPAMLARGGGAVVNTSSVAGLKSNPYGTGYAAAKYGVIGLTRSAAVEFATAGVRVNAVCPGGVMTPMFEGFLSLGPAVEERIRQSHPMGRFGAPDEIAEAVVWLCSDAASFVTGTVLAVDGGAMSI